MNQKIGEVKELLWRGYCREVCNYENPVIAEALRQTKNDVAAAVKLVASKWKLEPLGRMQNDPVLPDLQRASGACVPGGATLPQNNGTVVEL